MTRLDCDIPESLMAALQGRARQGAGGVAHLVSQALSQYFETPLHTLFQISTSGSLVAGVYAGAVTCAEILEHGDFGLGTFADLDGEMVVVNGHIYRVRGSGSVSEASPSDAVPFAIVTHFTPGISARMDGVAGYDVFKAQLDRLRRSDNLFYAIRIDGTFQQVRTRAVSPPKNHGRLLDAAMTQKEFDFRDAEGTLVGIYSPAFSGAFSVPGYHFHFLSSDRREGGHLLEIAFATAEVRAEELADFHLALPENRDFLEADLSKDISAELNKAESSH